MNRHAERTGSGAGETLRDHLNRPHGQKAIGDCMATHRTLSKKFTRFLFAWIAAALLLTQTAFAFTQSGFGTAIGNAVPMGHEWVTRRAAIELLLGGDHDPVVKPDPNDPRRKWTMGLAKNLSLKGAEAEVLRIKGLAEKENRYQSTYRPVFDSIVGERWVDIGGYNITTSKMSGMDCWDAVAQEPVEIQEDHFMRRYDDSGAEGGVRAASEGQQRFIRYFVEAATAPPTSMLVWDGGGSSLQEQVDRNYFLMGRAAHLFEDSFSSEHTVRIDVDNLERVRQVKSYLCAFGSEQHTHDPNAVLDYSSGDVIWLATSKWSGINWQTYKPSNMKTTALVAMEATKDLWAAFIRTMAVPREQRQAKAEAEAKTLVGNWLSFDAAEMRTWYDKPSNRLEHYVLNPGQSGPGQTQSACMVRLGVKSGKQSDKVAELEKTQSLCLWNVESEDGYSDLFDPQIRMFYNWQKKTWDWNVPSGWRGLERSADTGKRVRVSLFNPRSPMSAKLGNGEFVSLGGRPLDLIMVPTPDNVNGTSTQNNYFFRATFDPWLFLSYGGTFGAVKLWNGTRNSSYQIGSADQAKSIMNLYWKQYIWADDKGNVYLTKKGDPKNMNSQWAIDPSP
jgi:hypothetical protein